MYCTQHFTTSKDLAERKVRTSSVGQLEMISALVAIPIVTPFSDPVNAIKYNVGCAITGTMSGNQIGLLNDLRCIAPRHDQLDRNFAYAASLAAFIIWWTN